MLTISATASGQIGLGRAQSRWGNISPERHEQDEIGKESLHWCVRSRRSVTFVLDADFHAVVAPRAVGLISRAIPISTPCSTRRVGRGSTAVRH